MLLSMSTVDGYRHTIAEGSTLERANAFSDAVFAIAMTLLVLEIHLPDAAEGDLATSVTNLVPAYLTFVLSFAVVGAVWLSHHRKFRAIAGYDQTLLRLNLLMLLFVASLPLPTALLGRFGDEPLSVYIYAASISLIGFLMSAMWIYAWHQSLTAASVTVGVFRYVLVQSFPIPGMFLLSIPVAALFGAVAAEVSWGLTLPLSVVITRLYRSRRGAVDSTHERKS
jgi:uncharacterized membrane protein